MDLARRTKWLDIKDNKINHRLNFYQIDTDDEVTEEIVDHFDVKALPTILYLKNGEVVGNVVGVDIQLIENTINDNL